MSLPAFGDRKRIEIICLGDLWEYCRFPVRFNRTADGRFPAWAKHSRTQSSLSQTVRTLPSGPAISEAGPSEGTIASGTAVATDSVSPTDMASLRPQPSVHPYSWSARNRPRQSLRPRDLRIGHWKLHELSVVRKNRLQRERCFMSTRTRSSNTFSARNVPVLVDFYASWCGPCKKLAPTLEQVAAESPQAKAVKVDIDNNPKLAAQYGIKSLPSLLVFKDGCVVAKQQGVVAKQQGVVAKSRLKSRLAL